MSIFFTGSYDDAEKRLARILKQSKNTKENLDTAIEVTMAELLERLDTETNPDGSGFKKKLIPNGKKEMEASGDLLKDVQDISNYSIQGNTLVVTTKVFAKAKEGPYFYGYEHNKAKTNPGRTFAGDSKHLRDNISEAIRKKFK